jgi:hypothetical protein
MGTSDHFKPSPPPAGRIESFSALSLQRVDAQAAHVAQIPESKQESPPPEARFEAPERWDGLA